MKYVSLIKDKQTNENQITIHESSPEKKDGEKPETSNMMLFGINSQFPQKHLNNTILSEDVKTNLTKNTQKVIEIEEYYYKKGKPYKRGYLLYGVPGSEKTSTIKALPNQYSRDTYILK